MKKPATQILQELQKYSPNTDVLKRNNVSPFNLNLGSLVIDTGEEFKTITELDRDNDGKLFVGLARTYNNSNRYSYPYNPEFIKYWGEIITNCLYEKSICRDIGVNYTTLEGSYRIDIYLLLFFKNFESREIKK